MESEVIEGLESELRQLRRAPRGGRPRPSARGRGRLGRIRRGGAAEAADARSPRASWSGSTAALGNRRLLPPNAERTIPGRAGRLLRDPHAARWQTQSRATGTGATSSRIGGELIRGDLEILRRIDPQGGEPADPDEIDLDAAWELAAESIVAEHNERTDLRARQEQIGPRQRWALELLRDPNVALPVSGETVDEADTALSVERSSAVRRALREVQQRLDASEISRDTAATDIIGVVEEFGLRPVKPPPLPEKIDADQLGVVCWMAVLSPAQVIVG